MAFSRFYPEIIFFKKTEGCKEKENGSSQCKDEHGRTLPAEQFSEQEILRNDEH